MVSEDAAFVPPRVGRHWLRVAVCLLAALLLVACSRQEWDYKRVKRLQAQGKWAASVVLLDKAVKVRPEDAQAQYLLGLGYNRIGKGKDAIEPLRNAAADTRYLVSAGNLEATIHLRRDDPGAAFEAASRVLAEFPDDARALTQRARARAELGEQLEEGLRDVEQVLSREPNHRMAQIAKASLLIELDRFDSALAALLPTEDAWLAGEKSASNETMLKRWCEVRLGLATERAEKSQARRLFGYCLREYENDPQLRLAVFYYYKAIGDIGHVEPTLRAALDKKPTNLAVREGLARALRADGRPEEARELLLEGVRLSLGEDQFQAYWALVGHYEELGQYELAIDALEGAMELQADPRLPFRHVDLLVLDGQLERAMDVALGLEGQVYVDLGVGRVLLAEGKPREALERFEAGLSVWSENAGAHYYTGVAAEELGDDERAMLEYRESLRLDPEMSDAARGLARLLEQS